MNAVNNRRNHNFQIAYFLAGSCHTADGAYALLCDLREERRDALANVKASTLRARAKDERARKNLDHTDHAVRLEAEADLAELDAGLATSERCVAAANAELDFIERCIEKVEPLRKFRDLPEVMAHEAAQREEWLLELVRRAENFVLLTGTIPPDHFETMRQHPDFRTSILPRVTKLIGIMHGDPRTCSKAALDYVESAGSKAWMEELMLLDAPREGKLT